METFILERKDEPPQGGGEPAIIAVGAVLEMPFSMLRELGSRRMPFTPERVLEAMKKV